MAMRHFISFFTKPSRLWTSLFSQNGRHPGASTFPYPQWARRPFDNDFYERHEWIREGDRNFAGSSSFRPDELCLVQGLQIDGWPGPCANAILHPTGSLYLEGGGVCPNRDSKTAARAAWNGSVGRVVEQKSHDLTVAHMRKKA